MRIFNKGFHFGQDGPGNRLVYHVSGCNMHCIWCSNPEGMSGEAGTDCSVEELLSECQSCRKLFFSGGGVPFTGGEATRCYCELLPLLEHLQQLNIHTAIETNATSAHLLELARRIDYLIMDFKHYDSSLLKQYTGIGNEQIQKNFEALAESGRQLHVRIPLIHGINTQNPYGFAEYFSRYNTANTVFEFLPYHEYGRNKWTEKYQVQNGFVAENELQLFRNIFRRCHLTVIQT